MCKVLTCKNCKNYLLVEKTKGLDFGRCKKYKTAIIGNQELTQCKGYQKK